MGNLLSGLLGAGVGFLTGGPVGAIEGGLSGSGLLGGGGQQQVNQGNAATQQQQALAGQAAAQQKQLFNTASPFYGSSLNTLFSNAGYGLGPGQVYDAPQQRAQLDYANENLGKLYNQGANNLRFQYNQMGMGGSGRLASAIAALQRGQQQDLGNFARQQAINAVDLQNQRMTTALQAANPGLTASPIGAANVYGNAAGTLYGQGNTQNSALQQAMQGLGAYQAYNAQNWYQNLPPLQGAYDPNAAGGLGGTNYDLGGGYNVDLPF